MLISIALFAVGCAQGARASSPAEVSITIDTAARKPISRYIYGVNFPDWTKMRLPFPVARLGGNRTTAYNWETNASNAGNDWHNQNDGYMGESNEAGWTLRTFLEGAQSHGAAAIITIPTAGYVAADKKGDGDVSLTPDYLNVRFFKSYARKAGGHFAYPPDTSDRAVYQDECVAWLEKIRSPKTPVWYMLDNEPDIWAGTHSKIVTKPVTYAQIIANNEEFGSAIKQVAPHALVFGPANYGWMGFRTFQNAPDANGRDFLDVYLDAMRAAEQARGGRILDVLDVHWYPEAQGGGLRITTNEDKPGTAEARVQAPRSLWDAGYVEKSWIADNLGQKAIALLPRIQRQIDEHYPGTKLSISEYNYGGAKVISGAIAQADVLGIFGRYGLFAACNWGVGPSDTAQLAGFRAYLDFDGKGARFGDIGLGVKGEEPAQDSVFASLDSKDLHRLTIVAINKAAGAQTMRFTLSAFRATKIRSFTIDAGSLDGSHPSDAKLEGNGVRFRAPGLSVTTIEVHD